MIVKSTVREVTRNWTTDIHWESEEQMTKYLWYNGSTSFVDGEQLKREREDEVKAKDGRKLRRFPYQRHET